MGIGQVVAVLVLGVALIDPRTSAQTLTGDRDVLKAEVAIEIRNPACVGCPEWRVTFQSHSAALECFSGCTVPGIQQAPYSATEFEGLLRAFDEASFQTIPRLVGGCIDCDVVTLTYRDQRRIHEVVDTGSSDLPALERLQRTVSTAARMFEEFVEPSAANYQKLLDRGWAPNETVDPFGGTMLNYAVEKQDASAVALLLARGARVNRLALERARMTDVLALLWRAAGVSSIDPDAGRLLRIAASGNHTDILRWLLEQNVDVNRRDPETGVTPLMGAARFGTVDALLLLLERGAPVDLRDNDGNHALWFAVERDNDPRVIALLLSRGLQVNDVNRLGRTPLMHAAESCAPSSIRQLIRAGADINRRDMAGGSARDFVPPGRGWRTSHCQAARDALGSQLEQ